jgi:hypothetical protein
LNWKAKVVCGTCNNGWMSEIETHAKPAMTDLIVGEIDVPISGPRARDIARFAFKSAVVVDHMKRGRVFHSFPRPARHQFKQKLEIPLNVRMWFAPFLPKGAGRILSFYYGFTEPKRFELYVCTYCVGHFAFQVLTEQSSASSMILYPVPGFELAAAPFSPHIDEKFTWPPRAALSSVAELELFASRWRDLSVFRF